MKLLYFTGFLVLLGCGTSAHLKNENENAVANPEDCLTLYQKKEWKQTLECLENVPYSSRDQAYFDLKGSALMQIGQYDKAHPVFLRALDLDKNGKNPYLHFKYGESLWQVHQYMKAGQAIRTYLEAVDNPNPGVRKKAEYYIRSAHEADSLYRHPRSFDPVRLSDSINSIDDELGISMTYDRRHLILTRRTNQEDLYQSFLRHGIWKKAMPIPSLNTLDNEGAAAISGDGQLLVFTACNQPSGIGSCDLYFSIKQDTGWSQPELMPVVNSRFWDSQPTLSPDGKAIIFSSTRPGGQGGKDLWLSVQGKKGWIQPLNLGPAINSSGNEENPFLHTDQYTLYFTSDFWPGFGGRDLFMTHRIRGNEWTKPHNLGYPINSHENEEGIFIESSGKKGFFSSAREGSFDLYSFLMDSAIRPRPSLLYEMIVTDSITGKPLGNGSVEVFDWTTDQLVRTVTTDKDGYAAFIMSGGREYGITVAKDNYGFYSYRKHVESGINQDLRDTIRLTPVADKKTIVLKNVLFTSGEARLLVASYVELNQLTRYLQENPELRIVLTGHTDNVGKPDVNLKLSKLRAVAVKNYLSEQGVALERMEATGKGETQPIATNNTPEGRQQNRRTEITIIK